MSATGQPRSDHPRLTAFQFLTSIFALLFLATHSFAGDTTLAWDPSPDSRVIGYRVYAGQASGSYSLKFDAGLTTSYTVRNLAEGGTYYFAVTAHDGTEESAFSNQASTSIPYTVPGANFSAGTTTGVAPFTVNFTSAATGSVTSYAWSFGDGGTSTQQNPAHAYAAPGSYTVSLTVKGPGGESTTTKQGYVTVTNPPPTASFTASPTSGAAPLAVTFVNTSTGAVSSYLWDFGNGASSIQASPSYSYAGAGTYTVQLTATGPGGSNTAVKTGYIVVTPADNHAPDGTILKPIAPVTIAQGESVAFEGIGSDPENNMPLTYAWDFGGGANASNLQNPIATFNTAGTYTVRLTVTDAYRKADTSPASTTVTVQAPANQPPNGTIVAPASTVTITQGQSIAFHGSGSDPENNTPLTYTWDFGGGAPASYLQNPTAAFNAVGTYTVKLVVSDSKGAVDPTPSTTTVSVLAPAPAPIAPSVPYGLVAAYGFNEGTGSAINDSSGNRHTGSQIGARWASNGRFGKALKFNGSNTLVNIPDTPALRLSTGMTLEAWVKPSVTTNSWRDVIYKGNDNYYLMASSPTSAVPAAGIIASDKYIESFGTKALPVGVWTHLAATYDTTTLRLYVNGILVSSMARTGTIQTSTSPVQIGGDADYGLYFQGLIDEVRIYNRALSASEIQSDMNTPVK